MACPLLADGCFQCDSFSTFFFFFCFSGSQSSQLGAEQQTGSEQGAPEQEERPGYGDGPAHRRPAGASAQEESRSTLAPLPPTSAPPLFHLLFLHLFPTSSVSANSFISSFTSSPSTSSPSPTSSSCCSFSLRLFSFYSFFPSPPLFSFSASSSSTSSTFSPPFLLLLLCFPCLF